MNYLLKYPDVIHEHFLRKHRTSIGVSWPVAPDGDVQNEEKFMVGQGESISIVPGAKHFISNESNEEIEFLVISNPPTDHDRIEIKE